MSDIDFILVSDETEGVPFLFLSAILATPSFFRKLAGQIVTQPFGDLAKLAHRSDISFLIKLAQRRFVLVLIFVDAALRHLPRMLGIDVFRALRSPSNEYEPRAIEHGHAGTGPIRQRFFGRHEGSVARREFSRRGYDDFALIATSTFFAQSAIRAMVAG